MKKALIFLITIISTLTSSIIGVNAEKASFYEGEYINGFYVNRVKGGIIHYNQMRVYRRSGDNMFSYCIEPFIGINNNSIYESSQTSNILSNEQMKKIKDIIHFGYGYPNHSSIEWYALTQLMVWEVADPSNDFYFTNYLNGNRISKLDNERNEIYNLINSYYKLPSMADTNIDVVEDKEITIADTNNVLNNYISNSSFAHIVGNNLVIDGLKEGKYVVELIKEDNSNSNIPLFYNSNNSQDMIIVGKLDQIKVNLTIDVKRTSIEITKIDSDTNSIKPSGSAKLVGAKYELMDSNKNKINELIIDKNNKAYIKNINYGTYYLKEITSGEGYNLDNNTYKIEITKDIPNKHLSLKNKVIEKEIEIHKKYGQDNYFDNEKDIDFELYDNNNKLIDTYTTDENGKIKLTLPYGKYIFRQKNTTDGYTKVNDFTINVETDDKELKELYDYKIKVPNTYSESSLNILEIIIIIIGTIYAKKSLYS